VQNSVEQVILTCPVKTKGTIKFLEVRLRRNFYSHCRKELFDGAQAFVHGSPANARATHGTMSGDSSQRGVLCVGDSGRDDATDGSELILNGEEYMVARRVDAVGVQVGALLFDDEYFSAQSEQRV